MTQRNKKCRRFKKAVKITLAVTAVCAIIYILWLMRVFTGRPTIRINYIDQYNELSLPDNYSEQDNAAGLYKEAFACFREMPKESRGKFAVGYFYGPDWPGDLDTELYETLIDWLTSNELALDYASEAATKPYYWIPQSSPDNSLIKLIVPHLNDFKHLTRAMALQALVDAEEGHFKAAFVRLRHTYHIGMHLAGEKNLIEQLVSYSILNHTFHCTKVILSNAEVPTGELALFQEFLEDTANKIVPLNFWLEQLMVTDLIQRLFTDNGRGNGHLIAIDFCDLFYPKQTPGTRQLMSIGNRRIRWDFWNQLGDGSGRSHLFLKCIKNDDRKTTAQKNEQVYALIEKLVSQTPWQVRSAGITCLEQVWAILGDGENFFLETLYPASHKLIAIYHETLCKKSALIAVLALTRFEIDKGQYPQTLERLIDTGYIKTLPTDPYSDGALIYGRTEDDFTLYSLGTNFKDDGGLHREESDRKDFDNVFWPIWKPEQQKKAEDPAAESMYL